MFWANVKSDPLNSQLNSKKQITNYKQISKYNDSNSKPDGTVFLANAGIQSFQMVMDSGFRRSDGNWGFLRFPQLKDLILLKIPLAF